MENRKPKIELINNLSSADITTLRRIIVGIQELKDAALKIKELQGAIQETKRGTNETSQAIDPGLPEHESKQQNVTSPDANTIHAVDDSVEFPETELFTNEMSSHPTSLRENTKLDQNNQETTSKSTISESNMVPPSTTSNLKKPLVESSQSRGKEIAQEKKPTPIPASGNQAKSIQNNHKRIQSKEPFESFEQEPKTSEDNSLNELFEIMEHYNEKSMVWKSTVLEGLRQSQSSQDPLKSEAIKSMDQNKNVKGTNDDSDKTAALMNLRNEVQNLRSILNGIEGIHTDFLEFVEELFMTLQGDRSITLQSEKRNENTPGSPNPAKSFLLDIIKPGLPDREMK